MGKHLCVDNVDICPIDDIIVGLAIERQKAWISGPLLCEFKELLYSHDVAKNIIVIGGSVTAGVATSGCQKGLTCNGRLRYGTFEQCSWVSR